MGWEKVSILANTFFFNFSKNERLDKSTCDMKRDSGGKKTMKTCAYLNQS